MCCAVCGVWLWVPGGVGGPSGIHPGVGRAVSGRGGQLVADVA